MVVTVGEGVLGGFIIEMTAESDEDLVTLKKIEKRVGILSGVKLSVDSSVERPNGTISQLTLSEYEDDPRE